MKFGPPLQQCFFVFCLWFFSLSQLFVQRPGVHFVSCCPVCYPSFGNHKKLRILPMHDRSTYKHLVEFVYSSKSFWWYCWWQKSCTSWYNPIIWISNVMLYNFHTSQVVIFTEFWSTRNRLNSTLIPKKWTSPWPGHTPFPPFPRNPARFRLVACCVWSVVAPNFDKIASKRSRASPGERGRDSRRCCQRCVKMSANLCVVFFNGGKMDQH